MSQIYESFIPVVHKCSCIGREQSKHAKNLFLDFAATESNTMHTIQIFQKEAFNGFIFIQEHSRSWDVTLRSLGVTRRSFDDN